MCYPAVCAINPLRECSNNKKRAVSAVITASCRKRGIEVYERYVRFFPLRSLSRDESAYGLPTVVLKVSATHRVLIKQ